MITFCTSSGVSGALYAKSIGDIFPFENILVDFDLQLFLSHLTISFELGIS